MGSSLQIYIALSALSFKFVPACQNGKLSVLFIYLLSSFICCCALLVDVIFFFFFFAINTRLCCDDDIKVVSKSERSRRREREARIRNYAKVQEDAGDFIYYLIKQDFTVDRLPLTVDQLFCAQF